VLSRGLLRPTVSKPHWGLVPGLFLTSGAPLAALKPTWSRVPNMGWIPDAASARKVYGVSPEPHRMVALSECTEDFGHILRWFDACVALTDDGGSWRSLVSEGRKCGFSSRSPGPLNVAGGNPVLEWIILVVRASFVNMVLL